MKIWLILGLFCGAAFASDFITKNEYAKMLYQNPRGIGCDKCHGSGGEGSQAETGQAQQLRGDLLQGVMV